ncbi:MAG: hypothetical protein ACKVQJ_12580 [Pyrinomonadaceae bacterium]
MKIKFLSLIFFLAAFVAAGAAQSVVVTSKKVEYKRPKPESEYKASFEINYPKVKAASPALSKKIEAALSYESVFNFKIKDELDDIQWLQGADYQVEYNKNGILGVKLFIEGAGAYPSGSTRYVVVNTNTGRLAKPADTFTNTQGLLRLVRAAKDKDVKKTRVELKKDAESDVEGFDYAIKESAQYHPVQLDQFTVSDKGIMFHHDYEFAHVIQALQPDGEFFFSWKQLKPYIKSAGLLSRLAR